MTARIKLGDLRVGLICARCSSTFFAKRGEGDGADVRCQDCGHVTGTFKEVREAQLAVAREKAWAGATKVLRKGVLLGS